MGDLGDLRCGVGSSEAALVPLVAAEVRYLDPTVGSLRTFRRAVSTAESGAAGVVLAYPTISQLERVPIVPRILWLRWVFRRRWVRVHLHEFDRLRRRHRLAVGLLVGFVADRIVVSSDREADALRTSYWGWAARAEIVTAPPANGSAPLGGGAARTPRPGVVGVVGQHRPDKGAAWLLEILERLDPRFDRLDVVGRGWDEVIWPPTIAARFTPVLHGELPDDEMADHIAGWELALAPYDEPPHDGRLSLRTPLAYGVPTLTRGPRPAHLRLTAPHLLFDDEVDLRALSLPAAAERPALAAGIAGLEQQHPGPSRPRALRVVTPPPGALGHRGGARPTTAVAEGSGRRTCSSSWRSTSTSAWWSRARSPTRPCGPPSRRSSRCCGRRLVGDLLPPRLRSAWNLWVRRRGLSVAGSMPSIRALAPELASRQADHDVVVLNHEELFTLLPLVVGHRGPVVAHLFDVKSVRAQQSAALATSRRRASMWEAESRVMRRLEAEGLGVVDVLMVPSDDDVQALARVAPSDSPTTMVVVPNGVDLSRFSPSPAPAAAKVLFFGSLHYAPNVDGVVWFATEVWPLVRAGVPTASLSVVGHGPTPEVQALGEIAGVEVVGDVPDAPPWYAATDVVVVPLRVGTGTRLKALEAMASGRPVVGTQVGLAGLGLDDAHDGPARIADDAIGLAASIVALLQDPKMAARVGDVGRRYVEARFGWAPIADAMLQELTAAVRTAGRDR